VADGAFRCKNGIGLRNAAGPAVIDVLIAPGDAFAGL
jgi:hypothetical protein